MNGFRQPACSSRCVHATTPRCTCTACRGTAHGTLPAAHAGRWLCPACAARRWYQNNATLICEEARRALVGRRLAETVALCLMARAVGPQDCGPCRCGDRVEAAT